MTLPGDCLALPVVDLHGPSACRERHGREPETPPVAQATNGNT